MAKSEKTIRAPQTASADAQTSGSMPTRRSTLAGLAATACGCQALPMFSSQAQAASDDPANMSPQAGDRFTYLHGDKVGQAIKPEDLPLGRDQKLVYPMDPATGVVRDGSRFNMMLLITLGAMGLMLCGLGAYGLVGRVVVMRFREIGIRMALGADRVRLAKSVMGSALRPMLLGGAVGLAVAFASARVLASQIRGTPSGSGKRDARWMPVSSSSRRATERLARGT